MATPETFPGFAMWPRHMICRSCAKIHFELLACPRDTEQLFLSRADGGIGDHGSMVDEGSAAANTRSLIDWLHLGPLQDIKSRANLCEVCRLVWGILQRHHGGDPPLTWQNKGLKCFGHHRELQCYAQIEKYGYFFLDANRTKRRNIRRLSLKIEVPCMGLEDYTGSPAYEIHFCIQGCDYQPLSVQQVLDSNGDRTSITHMSFSGRERPLEIDLRIIKLWIRMCKETHQCQGPNSVSPDLGKMRLIDVQERRLVSAISVQPMSYVALSYVWGGVKKLVLQAVNTRELCKPGALKDDLLPRTVSDAMKLLSSIDERYLWVDALCIQQDGPDKLVQISIMDVIYSKAAFTIIAASGNDANSGLPGLSAPYRAEQLVGTVDRPSVQGRRGLGVMENRPMTLMTTLSTQKIQLDHFLEDTPWYGRGWTLQERVLSPRNLIFTKDQVHWECNEASWCEESSFDIRTPRFYRYSREPSLHPAEDIGDGLLTGELGQQGSEKPTGQADELAHNESGKLIATRQDMFWGQYNHLVMRYTQRALTYDGDILNAFTGITTAITKSSGEEFSWGLPKSLFEVSLSWWSYSGGPRMDDCPIACKDGETRYVKFPSWSWMGWKGHVYPLFASPRLRTRSQITCYYVHKGEVRRVWEVQDQNDPRFERDDVSSAQLPSPPWKERRRTVVTDDDISKHVPHLLDSFPLNRTWDSILLFWTSSARFTISWPTVETSGFPSILDQAGAVVGSAWQCTTEYWQAQDFEGKECEFIVLTGKDWVRDNAEKDYLDVLQIRWQDGIAYRLNRGWIKHDIWMKANPVWKFIALG